MSEGMECTNCGHRCTVTQVEHGSVMVLRASRDGPAEYKDRCPECGEFESFVEYEDEADDSAPVHRLGDFDVPYPRTPPTAAQLCIGHRHARQPLTGEGLVRDRLHTELLDAAAAMTAAPPPVASPPSWPEGDHAGRRPSLPDTTPPRAVR